MARLYFLHVHSNIIINARAPDTTSKTDNVTDVDTATAVPEFWEIPIEKDDKNNKLIIHKHTAVLAGKLKQQQ